MKVMRYSRIRLVTGLMLFMVALSTEVKVHSQSVVVYPGVESEKSSKYKVVIRQGDMEYESFVYEDDNPLTNVSWLTAKNHWTTLSFTDTIRIEVTNLTASTTGCEIYPSELNITPVISGGKVSFTLDKPAKVYLKQTDGQGTYRDFKYNYNNPLFIFADPPETDIPDTSTASVLTVEPGETVPEVFTEDVLYFKPGVHDIGERFKMYDNKTYYLAGGSFVYGSLRGANVKGNASGEPDSGGSNNVIVRGRGILCGRNMPNMPYHSDHFDGVSVYFGFTGTGQVVKDVTIIDPACYCIQSYGGELLTDNVKCMGWWYETDGWVGGNKSILRNSFFKVNDDVVKVYFEDQVIEDLVIYHAANGACFQLGWGADHDAKNTLVRNINVVQDDAGDPSDNRSFINGSNTNGFVNNLIFRDINVDQNLYSVIIIKQGTGKIQNILVQNMRVAGTQKFSNKLSGTIDSIEFQNLTINGSLIKSELELDLTKTGEVTNIIFSSGDITYFTITASGDPNGTITPSGNVVVQEGDDKTFFIAPASGFEIENVLVDGNSKGKISQYTFDAIAANHTISASFLPVTGISVDGDLNWTGGYPIHANGVLKLEVPGDMQQFRIKIYNLSGMLLYDEQFVDPGKIIEIPASQFDAGILLVKLISPERYFAKKVLIR